MSGEQLERSILERKEREELKAIATAMSLEPVARSKKADLVDQILRAAGVEVSAEDNTANGRPTGRAPASAPAPEEASPPEGSDAAVGASANGKVAKPRATRARVAKPKATAEGAEDASAKPTAVNDGDSPVVTHTATPELVADDFAGAGSTTAGTDGSRQRESDGGGGPAGRDHDDYQDHEGGGVSSDEASGPTDAPATNGSGRLPAKRAREYGEETGTNGPGNVERSGPERSGNTQNQNRHPRQQQGGGQGPGQGSGGGGQGQGQGNSAQGQQIDPGNRRSRRRRGRDRVDREFQGGSSPQQEAPFQGELVPVKGLLDLRDEGYGFLRTSGYLPSTKDVYVSVSQARRFSLRRGDAVEGACRPAGPSEKYPALLRIDSIGGMTPEEAKDRPRFEDLTPLFPDERLRLESRDDPSNVTARIVDLISPIGKGQRGMIVSPSKAGKTTIMKQIAHSVELNNPGVHLMVLLVAERPEEVTDMRRSVKGEVIASTFDRPADEHTALSELTIERAKRLVEMGRDVVIILDGITRLARAYNLAQPATGRIMSGGVDSGALYPPKKFFGAARNIEEGGSLTILATALVETGSKMDEVIFEEFKGTGNMELRLDRKLAERRIYPAIDVNASSTRHEELLFDRSQLQQVWKLRRVLNALGAEGSAAAGLELLMDKIKTTRSNDEFLAEIAKAPAPSN
jgi:transcription termination factor Rho